MLLHIYQLWTVQTYVCSRRGEQYPQNEITNQIDFPVYSFISFKKYILLLWKSLSAIEFSYHYRSYFCPSHLLLCLQFYMHNLFSLINFKQIFLHCLKGRVSRDFYFNFFSWIVLLWAPNISIRVISMIPEVRISWHCPLTSNGIGKVLCDTVQRLQ
jgi:hypothetical protein